MNADLTLQVIEWCRANRQWSRANNIAHVRFQMAGANAATRPFWFAVLRQYVQSDD